MSAFKASSLQDFAPVGCFHALAEAVLLAALALFGLECSFAHGFTSLIPKHTPSFGCGTEYGYATK